MSDATLTLWLRCDDCGALTPAPDYATPDDVGRAAVDTCVHCDRTSHTPDHGTHPHTLVTDETAAMLDGAPYACPCCGESATWADWITSGMGPPERAGWSLGVTAARLAVVHYDGTPLCPVMTRDGYRPAYPVPARAVTS